MRSQSTSDTLTLSLFDGKVCTRCRQWYPFDRFPKQPRMRDGRDSVCWPCKKKKCVRQPRITETEAFCTLCKKWLPHDAFQKSGRYGLRHRCKACHTNEQIGYRNRNREITAQKSREYTKQWKQANADRVLYNNNIRRARRHHAEGAYTFQEWKALCAKYADRCLRCGRSDVLLTPDHVVPLSKGGANSIENIQPLCVSCNCSKHDKDTDYRPKG